jgi:hypothetical protein
MRQVAGVSIDPQVQAIFDAMVAYMQANNLPSCSCSAYQQPNGLSMTMNAANADGETVTVTYFVPNQIAPATPPATPPPPATITA